MSYMVRPPSNLPAAVALTFVALVACTPSAPTLSVVGRVLDANTQLPVADAVVTVQDTNQQAVTHADGRFSLPVGGNPNRLITLYAAVSGYGDVYRQTVVQASAPPVDLFLHPAIVVPLSGLVSADHKVLTLEVPLQRRAQRVSRDSACESVCPLEAFFYPPPPCTPTASTPAPGLPALPAPPPQVDPNAPLMYQPSQLGAQSGSATFALYANTLYNPATGRVLQQIDGSVHAEIAYWQPGDSLLDSPTGGSLIAEGGTISPFFALETYGMAQLLIYQGAIRLTQVANTSNILSMLIDPTLRDYINGGGKMPQLWVVDRLTGLWKLRGDTTNGTMIFDPNFGTFQALVDSLLPWNVATGVTTTNGGCVTGTVYNACDGASTVPNYDVTVWFLGKSATRDWHGTSTDPTGQYCLETPLTDYWPGQASVPQDVNYFVSGASIGATNMCDPLPPQCRSCDPASEAGDYAWRTCNNCALSALPDGDPDDNIYNDTCTPPTGIATLQPCHFCPGDPNTPPQCTTPSGQAPVISGGCTDLAPVMGTAPGCSCTFSQQACTPGATCCFLGPKSNTPLMGNDPVLPGNPATNQAGCGPTNNDPNNFECHRCTKMEVGTPCDEHVDTCCSSDPKQPLVCRDQACVPAVDPTDTHLQ